MAKTPFSADYIHKLLKTIPEAERSKFLEMLEEQPIIGQPAASSSAATPALHASTPGGVAAPQTLDEFCDTVAQEAYVQPPPAAPAAPPPQRASPAATPPKNPAGAAAQTATPAASKANPRQNPRAHQPQHRHRQARHLRKIRPRLLHLSWMRIRQGPLPVPRHKVPLQRRRELPLLLQMPPLPELALSSTMAPATPRFASFNSGRAGRSVAHVKTLSVRRRSPTAVTAFTQCTAAGTCKRAEGRNRANQTTAPASSDDGWHQSHWEWSSDWNSGAWTPAWDSHEGWNEGWHQGWHQ